MATLITTPGAEYQNSYCDLADADAYHETVTKSDADAWTSIQDEDVKVRALIQATRKIDALFKFIGRKTNPLQPLQWPRRDVPVDGDYCGVDLIPQDMVPAFLKKATAELARSEFLGATAETDILNQISKFKAGSFQVDFKEASVADDKLPNKVYLMLRDYGVQDSGEDDEDAAGFVSLVRC